MRDMPTQRYMFPVDGESAVRVDDRPRGKRDPDHEARKLLAGEIEAAIMFDNKHVCNPGKLTPEERGAVAQAIRAQAARKRPRLERRGSPAFRLLAAQIEYLIAIYELTKSMGLDRTSQIVSEVGRIVKGIGGTIARIKETENVAK